MISRRPKPIPFASLSRAGFSPALSVLVPAYALDGAPPPVARVASTRPSTLSYCWNKFQPATAARRFFRVSRARAGRQSPGRRSSGPRGLRGDESGSVSSPIGAVCSPRTLRSGSLGYPAPRLDLHRLRCGPRGLPLRPRRRDRCRPRRSPSLTFAPVQRPRSSRVGRARPSSPEIHRVSSETLAGPDSDRLAPPSTSLAASTPAGPARAGPTSATKVPPPPSRSDLVVSHHLAGFLRLRPPTAPEPKLVPPVDRGRGLVASRCRSWGSPRFPPPIPSLARTARRFSRGASRTPSSRPASGQVRVTTAWASGRVHLPTGG
jgi:hypothetical protein